jgi:hypothetical protein
MLTVYVAGKISKNSVFGTHYWRDDFCKELTRLSGIEIQNLDPTMVDISQADPDQVFGADCYLISTSDVLIVYLSDDISVGGSQEILIAKYFKIPVIGLAPFGGKFNGSTKEMFGKVIKNYKDPFVFATCDVVCKDLEHVASVLKDIKKIKPKTIDIIPELAKKYRQSVKRYT